MQRVVKERLEEVVTLLNDTENTVEEKEIKEKVERILSLLNDPKENDEVKRDIHSKLDKVLELVNRSMVDPDIDIKYCMPEKVSAEDNDVDPYFMITYVVGDYNHPTRKFRLRDTILRRNTPESIANQVTFSIEEFKGEIDSVQMG